MKKYTTSLIYLTFIFLFLFLSCRSKRQEENPASKRSRPATKNLPPQDSYKQRSIGIVDQTTPPADQASLELNAPNLKYRSYNSWDKEFIEAMNRLPISRTTEDREVRRKTVLRFLDARKDLLFSIPLSKQAEKDRKGAWDFLEIGKNGSGGVFYVDEQNEYAENLLKSYADAPQIEKIVMWEVIRSRMEYPKTLRGGGGDATGEVLLKFKMAKLLFSALGIEKQELFDTIDIKTRLASVEAERKANVAEDEIQKLYVEQSKVAEQILEKHWQASP